MTARAHLAISRMARMRKPVVAAINGVVAGGGMGLAAACDLAVAAESAQFNMAYTALGVSPDLSTSFFLPRMVGVRRAMELALLNRVLSAAEALEWGLVNRVAPDDALADEAHKLAVKLARMPTLALAAAKRLLYQSFENPLEAQMEAESEAIADVSQT
ncbi:MAG: enoyl-CoA hydratase, partial [bacterium]|nr:enoyl-CoA hydratase [bacterium]